MCIRDRDYALSHQKKVEIPVEKPVLYQKCGNCKQTAYLKAKEKYDTQRENNTCLVCLLKRAQKVGFVRIAHNQESCEVSFDIYCGVIGYSAMFKCFNNTDVSIVKLDIFTDECDGYLAGRMS